MNSTLKYIWILIVALVGLIVAFGCEKKDPAELLHIPSPNQETLPPPGDPDLAPPIILPEPVYGQGGAKVILLGYDGLEWKLLNQFISEGLLPNFKEMVEHGASGVLRTDFGDSPVTWTTIATGVESKKHGIIHDPEETAFDFSYKTIKYPRLWDVLEKFNLKSRIVSYFFIPEAQKEQFFPHFEPSPVYDQFAPIISKLALEQGFSLPMMFGDKLHCPFSELNAQLLMGDEKIRAIDIAPVDLFVAHFQDADEASHHGYGLFMAGKKSLFSKDLMEKFRMYGTLLRGVYQHLDRLLGEVRKKYPDALVVVCSDHGFISAPIFYSVHLQSELALLLGFSPEVINGTASPTKGFDAQVILQYDPTEVDGGKKIVNIETPTLDFSGAQAEQAATATQDILSKMLLQGEPLFEKKSPTRIGISASFSKTWTTIPPFSGPYIYVNMFSGTHFEGVHGVILMSGPKVIKGTSIKRASVQDVAPTIYGYLNLPLAKDLDGVALKEAFVPEGLPGLHRKKVPSYGIAPDYNPNSLRKQLSPDEITRLQSLGYLE